MFYQANQLKGYKLSGIDGVIGKVEEFYFDDRHWTIRYLVANTGNWLRDRQVLISPYALGSVFKEKRRIAINLTKAQIEDSPSLDSDKPVSRQFEDAYYGFYGWPNYWGGPHMWGSYPFIMRDPEQLKDSNQEEKTWDPFLRSTYDVTGNHIQVLDGEIGHVDDFIIDDETWAIRYFIIDTRNWRQGKMVLIAPQWIERVSWLESKVFVSLPQDVVRQSPEYTRESLLTREYEAILYRLYDRKGYWLDEKRAKKQEH